MDKIYEANLNENFVECDLLNQLYKSGNKQVFDKLFKATLLKGFTFKTLKNEDVKIISAKEAFKYGGTEGDKYLKIWLAKDFKTVAFCTWANTMIDDKFRWNAKARNSSDKRDNSAIIGINPYVTEYLKTNDAINQLGGCIMIPFEKLGKYAAFKKKEQEKYKKEQKSEPIIFDFTNLQFCSKVNSFIKDVVWPNRELLKTYIHKSEQRFQHLITPKMVFISTDEFSIQFCQMKKYATGIKTFPNGKSFELNGLIGYAKYIWWKDLSKHLDRMYSSSLEDGHLLKELSYFIGYEMNWKAIPISKNDKDFFNGNWFSYSEVKQLLENAIKQL